VTAILVQHGRSDPLILEVGVGARAVELAGPPGVEGAAATALVRAAVTAAVAGPPLAAHAVPGDRVVVGIAGGVPQAPAVLEALHECLLTAGVAPADVSALVAPGGAPVLPAGAAGFGGAAADTAYLAADAAGRPLYLARGLVDADLVVEVGGWRWDASLAAPDPAGAIWPAFGRTACGLALERRLALRGRGALADWHAAVRTMRWQLGVAASLRLVPGRGATLHAACFGMPDDAAAAARKAAAAWRPLVDAPAALAVATLSADGGGPAAFTRAVAAAARVTKHDGTICLVGAVPAPGPVFRRWREGVAVRPLVEEAVAGNDPELVADAVQTRLFARALGQRRLVLLSTLDDALVDDLDFGNARTPEAVERLAARAESLVVLHEADRMLPRCRPV
jgi:hypothetical protein